jgi:hypothetical protein
VPPLYVAKMMKALWMPFALIAVLDAQEVQMQGREEHQVLAALEAADVANGIDATEAQALAQAFFLKNKGLCGGLGSMRREGRWWIFETAEGPRGAEGPSIRVHAESGWVSMTGCVELARPPWNSLRTWLADYLKDSEGEGEASESGEKKEVKNAEQAGAGQPATAPESRSEGKEKPKPQ